MKICVIGAGYVGLVSSVCLAEFGHDVSCVEINKSKYDSLLEGVLPIYESGLRKLFDRVVTQSRLSFYRDIKEGMRGAEIVVIVVETPTDIQNIDNVDLSYVFAAVDQIAANIENYTVVVMKSTVPVGTNRKIYERLTSKTNDVEFDVVSNPEFLREGCALKDFMHPDRVVIGVESSRAESKLRDMYNPLIVNHVPFLVMGLESAELVKYASNAFLVCKITFINEVADICEKTGGMVDDVAAGMGYDDRIGRLFLKAGPGYGGSCFPKDTLAFAAIGDRLGVPTRITQSVIESNKKRIEAISDKIIAYAGGSIEGKRVAFLGVTFKANTDDMREAQSLVIIPRLLDAGALISAYDPEGMKEGRLLLPSDVVWHNSSYEVVSGADMVVVLTEWDEFSDLDLKELSAGMNGNVLYDTRNIFSQEKAEQAGFVYYAIGLGKFQNNAIKEA